MEPFDSKFIEIVKNLDDNFDIDNFNIENFNIENIDNLNIEDQYLVFFYFFKKK